jgi:CYTH domain-containing protein
MAGRSVGPAAVELAGLSALRDRVEVRIGGLFAELRTDWLGDGSGRFTLELEALAARLEHDARADDAIERVFLLRGLPDLPAHAEVLDVDLGWLPGERLRERIRRQSGDTGTAYFRTLEFSEGLRRTEIEEPTSAEVFESLWRLTKDCRIRKRRYQVSEGGLVFAIDEFLDRELFLAEVELPDAAAQPRLPGWLAARVAREVTDDSRYTNFELARGGERSPSDG